MRQLVVGVGDCVVTANPDTTLITYALGSCIALALHDPVARVGGMLHFMLPEPTDAVKARTNPFMFAATGIPLLFQKAGELGARPRRLVLRAAGGAHMLRPRAMFDIGRRNHRAMHEILSRAGMVVHAESIGGTQSRTVRLDVASGNVWLRMGGEDPACPDDRFKGSEQWRLMV